jgi:hypothetical protein
MQLTGKNSIFSKLLQAGKDPISSRAKSLSSRARELKAEIRKLEKQSIKEPKFQRTTSSKGRNRVEGLEDSSLQSMFETIEHKTLGLKNHSRDPQAHYNSQGVKKLDPMGWIKRQSERNPASDKADIEQASTTKWVQYMATGGVQGIEPLRREKRIARNRFLLMFALFLVILCGIFAVMRP